MRFSNLPEDSFEAFLSVPILVKGRVVGVLNVQHRNPHSHSGDEMETINAVGHTIGALIALSFLDIATLARADLVEIVLGPRVGVQES